MGVPAWAWGQLGPCQVSRRLSCSVSPPQQLPGAVCDMEQQQGHLCDTRDSGGGSLQGSGCSWAPNVG